MEALLNAIDQQMTGVLGANLLEKSGDFMVQLAPFFSLGFSIYVMLLAFHYYKSGFDETIVDLAKKMLGWLLIIGLAFNGANLSALLTLIYELPETLIGWIGGSELNTGMLSNGFKIIQDLIGSLDTLTTEAQWYQIQLQITVFFAKVIVGICGTILLSFTWFFYLIAKLSLALTLVIGGFFIACMLFPATRAYGMNWIGQVLSYSFTCLLYSLIMGLQLQFVENQLESWNQPSYMDTIVAAWEVSLMLIILTILFMIITLSASNVASALFGGASVDGHGRTMGRLGSNVGRLLKKMPVMSSLNRIIGK